MRTGFVVCEDGIPRAFVPHIRDISEAVEAAHLRNTVQYAGRRANRTLTFTRGVNPERLDLPCLADWVDSVRSNIRLSKVS